MHDDWPPALRLATDDELTAALAAAIQLGGGGKLTREADGYMAGVCAERLTDQLALAGFVFLRRVPW
jgi:hypothetical protein